MKTKFVIRAAVVAGACLVAVALSGLSFADARSGAHVADEGLGAPPHCFRFDFGEGPVCTVVVRGPRGSQGPRGRVGVVGPVGPVGPTGPQGVQGVQGVRGVQGPVGATGLQGIQGAPGPTVVVAGTQVSVTAPPGGTAQGTQPNPSVAQCTVPAEPEAYGGGVQIQKSGPQSGGDVVTVAQHFLGSFVNSTTVSPLPVGTTPGTVSSTPANAYEGQAVVTQLTQGDTVIVQSFVICGP